VSRSAVTSGLTIPEAIQRIARTNISPPAPTTVRAWCRDYGIGRLQRGTWIITDLHLLTEMAAARLAKTGVPDKEPEWLTFAEAALRAGVRKAGFREWHRAIHALAEWVPERDALLVNGDVLALVLRLRGDQPLPSHALSRGTDCWRMLLHLLLKLLLRHNDGIIVSDEEVAAMRARLHKAGRKRILPAAAVAQPGEVRHGAR
jgi:hypothetical protein